MGTEPTNSDSPPPPSASRFYDLWLIPLDTAGHTYSVHRDVHWWARGDVRDLLLGPDGLRLPQWLSEGRATVVKDGPHRTVYRVCLPGRTVYVKHYKVPNRRAMLRQWLRRGKGRRERWQAMTLAARGIPTFVPLALGEQRRRGWLFENYLVTEAIEHAQPLDRFLHDALAALRSAGQTRLLAWLARALGDLAAAMHRGGILHTDFHAGNILIQAPPGGPPRLYLIDLHAVELRAPLDWTASASNLAMLNLSFARAARRSDRLRFLRAYLSQRPGLGVDLRTAARAIERRTAMLAARLWRSRDRRCLSDNPYFRYRTIGAAHGYATTDLPEAVFWGLLRDPDAPLRSARAHTIKDSRTTTVAELRMPLAGGPSAVIYKRFNCKKALDPVRGLVLHSRAMHDWRTSYALRNRGLPTPRPLAIIERIGPGRVKQSYLVCERVPDALILAEYADRLIGQPPGLRRRRVRELTRELARLVRALHERGFSHRDLKSTNVLVQPADPAAGPPRLTLIDLAGVRLRPRLTRARRVQNLARLHVSFRDHAAVTRADKLRFLRCYLSTGLARTPWKPWWRDIARATHQKIDRNRRSGRRLN